MAGAPQSAGCQGAAAGAAGGHGGDLGLRGSDVPVCLSHQTLGLLTHRYRDRAKTITYKFCCSCPPSFHSITPPVPQMDRQLLQPALVSGSQRYPPESSLKNSKDAAPFIDSGNTLEVALAVARCN